METSKEKGREEVIHELKIVQPYYNAVLANEKLFEIRYNDRDFQKGDEIILRLWDGIDYVPTAAAIFATITFVTHYSQREGVCVFGFRKEG